ncbi:unnamed protein product, partial [Ilex paraguariensis]
SLPTRQESLRIAEVLESKRSFIRSGSLVGGSPFESSMVLMLVCEENRGVVMGKEMVVV